MGCKRAGKSRRKGLHKGCRLFVFVFIVVFSTVVLHKFSSLWKQSGMLEAEMAQVRLEIEAEKEHQLDARAGQKYYSSEEYRERQARDRFNLIYPGEFIIEIR